jgi:hypothetical protein
MLARRTAHTFVPTSRRTALPNSSRPLTEAATMPVPRSVQSAELLAALADHGAHGLSDGEWYILKTLPGIDVSVRNASLCSRFGLDQDDLEELMLAAGITINAKAPRWSAVIKTATEKFVPVYKATFNLPGVYTAKLKCASGRIPSHHGAHGASERSAPHLLMRCGLGALRAPASSPSAANPSPRAPSTLRRRPSASRSSRGSRTRVVACPATGLTALSRRNAQLTSARMPTTRRQPGRTPTTRRWMRWMMGPRTLSSRSLRHSRRWASPSTARPSQASRR